MKKNIIRIIVCALVVAFAFTGSSMATDAAKKAAAPASDEKPAVAAEQVTVTGTVEKTDAGIVIKTADAEYVVAGQDLTEMIGKTVAATGTVDGKTITVTEAKESK